MSNQAKAAVLFLATTIFSAPLRAQESGKQSRDNLEQLQPGQKVRVVQMDMKSLKGNFLGFTDEMISLRVKKDEVAVPREEVLRVRLRGKPKRSTNAFVGAVIGTGLGAALFAATDKSGEPGLAAVVGAIIGAGALAGLGAAVPVIPSYQTIYRVERKKP